MDFRAFFLFFACTALPNYIMIEDEYCWKSDERVSVLNPRLWLIDYSWLGFRPTDYNQ